MNGSHIAGAGIGAIVGAVLVSLGTRIGLDLTNLDAATLGMAAVGIGTGIFHAIGEYGLVGMFGYLMHGRAPAAPDVFVPIEPPGDTTEAVTA